MLTAERLHTLRSAEDGTVTARRLNAPGAQMMFAPREHQVPMGFLVRAGMVTVETGYGPNRGRPVTITLTEKGKNALAASGISS